eukprot:8055477-Karenia_brevis.AAC.1
MGAKTIIWKEASVDECWTQTGKGPIRLQWVDVNKGDERNPRYRSRIVVTEFKKNGKRVLPDYMVFSSMPPLEA